MVAKDKHKVCVLGGGAWGSALACVAARAGHEVRLWARSARTADEINTHHTNKQYLGALKLVESVAATHHLDKALSGCGMILLAVPAQSIAALLEDTLAHVDKQAILVSCAKGIDNKTGLLPSELVAKLFPDARIGVLSGPGFAADVVRDLPTAVTVAGNSSALSDELAAMLSSDRFRCYASDDIKGVELGGALKNVLALAVGAARGMGLGASAEAALIARGFGEITRVAEKLGGRAQTLTGLSGLGDLVLTCSNTQSRNFTYGVAMGRGEPLENLKLAEGVFTAAIALKLARREAVDTPLIAAVVEVLEGRLSADAAVGQLLKRPLRRE